MNMLKTLSELFPQRPVQICLLPNAVCRQLTHVFVNLFHGDPPVQGPAKNAQSHAFLMQRFHFALP